MKVAGLLGVNTVSRTKHPSDTRGSLPRQCGGGNSGTKLVKNYTDYARPPREGDLSFDGPLAHPLTWERELTWQDRAGQKPLPKACP